MPNMPLSLGPGHAAALDAARAVGLLGRRGDLGHARQQPQLDARPDRAASGSPRRCAAATTRTSASRARIIPRPSCSRSNSTNAAARGVDPKTKKYTFVDTCFGTHHLQFGYDANDTLWTSGGGPVRRLAQHEDVRRDRRRREVAGLDGADARHQRQRQARRLRRAEPAGRSDQGQAHRGAASTR